MSSLDIGFAGSTIRVECHASNGLPGIVIVGLAQKSVDESKERLRAALASSPASLPKKRITINLAPADLPKDTASLDVAMVVAILSAGKQIPVQDEQTYFYGEVGLDGTIRPTRGIIGKLLCARKAGCTTAYIPSENCAQAELVSDMTIIPLTTISELYLHLTATAPLQPWCTVAKLPSTPLAPGADFCEVVDQARAKRALEIAAAGHHNVLLSGPPGTGKSMLAKAFVSILPPLDTQAMLEVTHMHSLVDQNYSRRITTPPFRSPHHSASTVSLVGGGTKPRPGEISLAHHGVLFLDELPEFSRSNIETLRQPLEDRQVTVSRAKDTLTFPADFILVATQNPCPCGYYGSSRECTCLPYELARYQKRLSGPIMDRIDLHVTVNEVAHADLLSQTGSGEPSESIRQRVIAARHRQAERYRSSSLQNSHLSSAHVKRYIVLDEQTTSWFNHAAEKLSLSARTYMRVLKVARTIADLDASDTVTQSHLAEALQYRPAT